MDVFVKIGNGFRLFKILLNVVDEPFLQESLVTVFLSV